jgi:signal transduction histidine kinase
LREREGQLILEIRDNGKGFDTSRGFPGHLGLQSMPERAAQIGGEFNIQSQPNMGTVIIVRLPR